jgi:hypothetical protein
MELRCPNCGSTDLKKASLAYEEGLSRLRVRSRLHGLLFADDGPNVIVGRAAVNGVEQTELARRLRPPKKWSYGKLWFCVGIVSVISLIFYTRSVMSSSSMVSARPVVVFGVIGATVLLALVALIWRNNQLVYPRQFAEWDESFLCERCGGVSRHPRQAKE